jgi:hypothetical protein
VRRLLAVLIVVAGLLVAVDFGVKEIVERAVARRVDDEFALQTPSVSIDDWPFLLSAVKGRLSSVSVSAGVGGGDPLQIHDVSLVLSDFRFSASDAVSGEMRSVEIGPSRGSATIADDDLSAALQEQGFEGEVRFDEGRVIVPSGGEADVTLRDGQLVLDAGAMGTDEGAVALPGITRGVTYESIDVGSGRAELSFRIAPGRLEI